MTLIIYYIISKYYQENRQLLLSAFSIINIVLISIQESRAGVLVAVILFALIIFDSIKTQGKQYIRLFGIIIIIVVILLVIKNIALIRDYLYGIGISESSYEDDVRSLATASFFSQMTWKTALFGYPMETMFAGVDRTFNAFLDLWKNFGILPFAAFFILVILRFSKRKRYSFPMYCFLPMFAYMFFESFMFHSYWDFLIYCFLF